MRKISLVLTLAMSGFLLNAQDQSTPRQPDNTGVNKQDRQQGEPTADQQKANASDRDMTKNIRRALVKDKSLSTYGHNVKVISENGVVHLRGPVRSEEEKRAIEAKAAEIAGSSNVRNELTVAPKGESDRSSK